MTRHVALAVALLAAAFPAAAAAAPSIEVDRPCYTAGTPMTITGSGFTPGGRVEVVGRWANGAVEEPFFLTADASGAISDLESVPEIEIRRTQLTIWARDVTAGEAGAPATASVVATVSFFGAWYRPWNTDGPAVGRRGRVRRLEADGFLDAGPLLYVHYRRAGRVVKTLRLGALRGACGSLDRRFREFAFKPVPPGTYRVRFNTSKRWNGFGPYTDYRQVVIRRTR